MEPYRTIAARGEDQFIEKKSRFIGAVRPVTTEEEALAFIQEKRKQHWDATHNVYAYVLREGQIRRYSDDGEPQGTAGMPVLEVLLKSGVTDCVVVVTRYFGGILLGAGGLVRAYSHGAKLGLEAGGIRDMRPCLQLRLSCDYSQLGRVQPLILQSGGVLEDTEYADTVTLRFHMPTPLVAAFEKELTDCSAGTLRCEAGIEAFYPFQCARPDKICE